MATSSTSSSSSEVRLTRRSLVFICSLCFLLGSTLQTTLQSSSSTFAALSSSMNSMSMMMPAMEGTASIAAGSTASTTTTKTPTSPTSPTSTTPTASSSSSAGNKPIYDLASLEELLNIGPSSSSSSSERSGRRPDFSAEEGLDVGVISSKPFGYFERIRNSIDQEDPAVKCARYRFPYKKKTGHPATNQGIATTNQRKIYFGALIASEPWEVFDIAGNEMYGLFEGIVFVESNRTQDFVERPFLRLHHTETMKQIFGVENIQIRAYAEEHGGGRGLNREHNQRAEILKGWKELGMQPEDIAILGDTDEFFSRDFIRALQVCDKPIMGLEDVNDHRCDPGKTGLRVVSQIYETTPECVLATRKWWQPSALIGHCIEGIAAHGNVNGSDFAFPLQNRNGGVWRPDGYGGGRPTNYSLVTKDIPHNKRRYPLYNGADLRRIGAARFVGNSANQSLYNPASGFHIHNFFTNHEKIRFKYFSYGHPDRNTYKKNLGELHEDLLVMIQCVRNESDSEARYKRVPGGFLREKHWKPLYFYDDDYRRTRQELILQMVEKDYEQYGNFSFKQNRLRGANSGPIRKHIPISGGALKNMKSKLFN